jgi:phage-related protein
LATEIGAAFISVGLGTNKLGAEIKQAFGGAGDVGESAGKEAGSRFGGAVGIAAAAIGALGIGSFFKSAVSGAADLEQSVGAISTVFGESAADMHAWADSAANDVGLSMNEFNELGTLIGSQLKNGGTAMDELAPKTQNLITLGADLSSMFGGTTSEAVEALSSALKGERDPIERYGVSLNQAKIDAEAAALGFSKVGGSLSDEATQAATLSLIMKQTADAHGNFGRESDTLAHKQQVLNAQWANGKAVVGKELLPVVAAFTGALSNALGPAINGTVVAIRTLVGGAQGLYDLLVKGDFSSAFAQAFRVEEDSGLVNFLFNVRDAAIDIGGKIKSALSVVGPMFSSLSATWGPLIPQVFALVSSFSPLSLIFQALGPVLPQIAGLFQVLALTLGTVLTGALQQLTPIIQLLVGALSGVLVSIMPVINAMFIVFSEALVTLVPVLMGVLGAIMPLVAALIGQLAPIITSLVTSILPPLMSIFGNVVNAIAPLVTIIAGLLIPIIQALMPVVVTVFSVVADVIKSAMQIVQGVIQVVSGAIRGDWQNVWTGVQNIFQGVWNTIGSIVRGALQLIGQVVISGLGLVGNFVASTLGSIGNFFSSTWNNVIGGVSGFIGTLVGFFTSLPSRITGALSALPGQMLGIGQNIIQGLINGVGGMIDNAVAAVRNVGGAMLDGIKGFLGIKSPSRVFKAQVGMMIGAGVIAGVNASQPGVTAAVNGLVQVPQVPSYSAGAYTPAGALTGVSAGGAGFNNYGTIHVRDEDEMARVILTRQQDALAVYR